MVIVDKYLIHSPCGAAIIEPLRYSLQTDKKYI